MKIYKVYGGTVRVVEVIKETKCFYWLDGYPTAFGWSSRIEKENACLTPQQAIQESLNGHRIMKGAFKDKLAKVEAEILNLEKLEQEYSSIEG